MARRAYALLLALALTTGGMTAAAAAASDGSSGDDVKTPVARESLHTGRFVVRFDTQADLGPAARIADRTARGWRVVSELQASARDAQAEAVATVAATPGATYEAFWISNAIVVDGPATLMEQLRSLSGVAEVRPEQSYPLIQPVEQGPADLDRSAPEWGISLIGADDVWSRGILGGGVVVGSLDSGVQYDHPALVNQYRGNLGSGNFDHNYNWFDASGDCPGDEPCDLAGHGTHTMGTMVGGDGPGPFTPDVGVAPGATWMTVSCGPVFCTDSQLLAAGEFFLAPTDLSGENPDPSMRPDIINNSWGGGPGDPFYLDVVAAWRAAGIIPVFASGNPGPFCGDGGSPGDYLDAFSVGATDINDVIAEFSGRGPSSFGKVNPDVSAPGVDVVSSVPGNSYASFSGTSMATPHTVGALALMLSANAALFGDVDGATDVMRQTALDIIDESCGGAPGGDPNNVYGDGRIDALAAVSEVADGGVVTGTITDNSTGLPIPGARVTAQGSGREYAATATEDGVYRLFLPEGSYDLEIDAFGYYVAGRFADVASGRARAKHIKLRPLPLSAVSGYVTQLGTGEPMADVTVGPVGVPIDPVMTDAAGFYSLVVPHGRYTMRAALGGCTVPETADVDVTADTGLDFSPARKIDGFGHGCNPVEFDWVDVEDVFPLSGDDEVGFGPLPFPFPFYGETYDEIFVGSNGHVGFTDPFFSDFFNTVIPSIAQPNAAIYPLWQDLVIDGQAQVTTGVTVGELSGHPQQVFVITFEKMRLFGQRERVDFQVQLWEDGTIDLLYGKNIHRAGNGLGATIGIENADGSDALMFSFREALLESQSAWRYEPVAAGTVYGRVVNANDGRGVPGAMVVAYPTGRSATTDARGKYELTLTPGRYDLEITAQDYGGETGRVWIFPDERSGRVFELEAAQAAPVPLFFAVEVDYRETTTRSLLLSNTGTLPLTWSVSDREAQVVPPEVRPRPTFAGAPIVRHREWRAADLPDGFRPEPTGRADFTAAVSVIIDDPVGDSLGTVDITTVRGGSDAGEMSLAIDYAPGTPMDSVVGLVYFDTDQDPFTGIPGGEMSGNPEHDIGVDYFAELFEIHNPEDPVVLIWDTFNFDLVGVVPAAVIGQTVAFDVPLDIFGPGEDGSIDVTMDTGVLGPEDWAPNAGHGTIASDAAWIEASPLEGTLDPGETASILVTMGTQDPLPGLYAGAVLLTSNDPRNPVAEVGVEMLVRMPDSFGVLRGTVFDGLGPTPISGAAVSVAAEFDGDPIEFAVQTDQFGDFSIPLPAGVWPVVVVAGGFVPFEGVVTVVAGVEGFLDVELFPDVPLIAVGAVSLDFALAPGESDAATVTVSNVGSQPLEWSIGEREVSRAAPVSVPSASGGGPLLRPPSWSRFEVAASGAVAAVRDPRDVSVIVVDPVGDALDGVDIEAVLGGSDGATLSLEVVFTPESTLEELGGFVLFDTDQDPFTGVPAEEFFGLPEHDIGVDYFADFFGVAFGDPVFIVDTELFEVVAEVPGFVEESVFGFDVPLEVFGPGELGDVDLVVVGGNFDGPTDWAPDAGHASISGLVDVPWLDVVPGAGVLGPGESVDVDVTVDATGLDPAVYAAQLLIISNDPFTPTLTLDANLAVMPPGYGTVRGSVFDALSLIPVPGAAVTVDAEPDGATALSRSDGSFALVAPAGVWPVVVVAGGFVPFEGVVTVVAGVEGFLDVELFPDVPLIAVGAVSLDFALAPGESDAATVTVSNVGSQPLEWSIGEREVSRAAPVSVPSASGGGPLLRPPSWSRFEVAASGAVAAVRDPRDVSVIVVDPVGDALDGVDIEAVLGGSDGATLSLEVVFTPESTLEELGGFVLFDTDQDPFTGVPAEEFFGLPEHDIGVDYFADFFGVAFGDPVFIVDTELFEVVAEVPGFVEESVFGFDVPLEVFGPGELGDVDLVVVGGNFDGPTDWAPDAGHASISGLVDVPWLDVVPGAGVLGPGESVDVDVTVDATGLDPAVYAAQLLIISNDPFTPTLTLDVVLEVL